ncbi:threonine--tRNA ligase [Candidatus Woesearchaeota archaeon]|nr:threonine--tRNA ligase [Candidatus Woesearchaeota archaeon]
MAAANDKKSGKGDAKASAAAKEEIKITFPDGASREFLKGTTPLEVARTISRGLAEEAVAAKVNGVLWDLTRAIECDASLQLLKFDSAEGKSVFWHSAAHIMAQAITRLFPFAKLTIGPTFESGFYYDIEHEPFKPDDLVKVEEEMAKVVAEKLEMKRDVLAKEEALKLFKDNSYKVEIINEDVKTGEEITAYRQGTFVDLCHGPHVPNTSYVKAFKLTKISGAYWRGDAKNKPLQRVYGIAFPSRKQLDDYSLMLQEAEKRDHRKLGKDLELFMFHDWSPGSAFFLPKGTVIYNELISFVREEYRKRGYKEVITPQLFNKALWELSGHWQHYKENMFVLNVDNEEFSLKPMNCPSHVLMFKSRTRSYRELPLRIADFCNLHRNELKGVLGGLTRVRKFSQDDSHIFCTNEQISSEIMQLLDFVKFIYVDTFKFEFKTKLSTKPEKSMGDPKLWDLAEKALEDALKASNLKYEIKAGEGAFYGPKIDFDVRDSIGRDWQLATIQLDFQMPLKMEAEYEGQDGKRHTAVMIHRALLGSLERFIGVLTEHYAGKFPLWLSPEQVRILTVADRFNDYAGKLRQKYLDAGIRAEVDDKAESVPYKVREAELDKVNYIIVVGEKEVAAKTVTVRKGKEQCTVDAEKFLQQILREIKEKV